MLSAQMACMSRVNKCELVGKVLCIAIVAYNADNDFEFSASVGAAGADE